VHQVGYEALMRDPAAELARVFAFLGLPNEPRAVDSEAIAVGAHARPVEGSVGEWVGELQRDARKLELAREIVAKLDAGDVRTWGYEKDALFAPLEREGAKTAHRKPKVNGFVVQRKVMLALKHDIDKRPHGKLLQRVRYYCNVLLRE
jgi:hypothetical protein